MSKSVRSSAALGAAAIMAFAVLPAYAAERLTLYCSPQEEWCQIMVTSFEKETGATVAMTRKSSGETYAQIAAEQDNPKGDVWWGGTGDPHLQAAEEGLTETYTSPLQGELQDWAVKQHAAADGRTVGIYAGALGFGYNKELLAQKGLPEPKCWADLIKPEFKGEIQMANPNSSGTAYTALATFVQMMGEDKAFDYLKQLHANINQYTKSGSAPIKAAAQGETVVGIVFQHDAVTMAVSGAPESEGVEVRPLKMTTGTAEFNEVFFNDVFVPDDDVVGPVDGGWTVARSQTVFPCIAQTPLQSGWARAAGACAWATAGKLNATTIIVRSIRMFGIVL